MHTEKDLVLIRAFVFLGYVGPSSHLEGATQKHFFLYLGVVSRQPLQCCLVVTSTAWKAAGYGTLFAPVSDDDV
jgi:hypothetical protein